MKKMERHSGFDERVKLKDADVRRVDDVTAVPTDTTADDGLLEENSLFSDEAIETES